MGRAGAFQAEVVCQNIVAMIRGQLPRTKYKPNAAEGAIKLTLGKVGNVYNPAEQMKGLWR